MKGRHFFFATRDDVAPGLEFIEARWELEYCLDEMREDRAFCLFSTLLAWEGLGRSDTGNTARDAAFFVYPRPERPTVETIPQRKGGARYTLRPSSGTVHFRPGGLHSDSGAFVAGVVARAVAPSSLGVALYQDFSKAVVRGFHKVGLFWMGSEAYREFKSGRRMVTIGIKSPREYDLAEPLPR